MALNLGRASDSRLASRDRRRFTTPRRRRGPAPSAQKSATPRKTTSAMRDAALLVHLGDEVAGGHVERDPGRDAAARRAPRPRSGACPATPASVAAARTKEAARAPRLPRPEASAIEATVTPSGILCSTTAQKISRPSGTETRKPDAIDTPSKKVWMDRPDQGRDSPPRGSSSRRRAPPRRSGSAAPPCARRSARGSSRPGSAGAPGRRATATPAACAGRWRPA